jgi:uncharacterized protein
MKIRVVTALTCAAALLMSGVANAATAFPVKERVLINNPLYKAGKLPKSDCEEQPVRRNDRASAKNYLNGVLQCLEATWEQHLSEAGWDFEAARVKYVSGEYCGLERGKHAGSLYCLPTRTIAVRLGKEWLDDPSDLWLFYIASTMYARHAQRLVLISYSVDGEAFYDGEAERAERVRRYHLQADCLAGAFMKSVWPLDGRSRKDWNHLRSIVQGDTPGDERLFGKTSNLRKWLDRGFATGDPGSCNTWAAPSSEVA